MKKPLEKRSSTIQLVADVRQPLGNEAQHVTWSFCSISPIEAKEDNPTIKETIYLFEKQNEKSKWNLIDIRKETEE